MAVKVIEATILPKNQCGKEDTLLRVAAYCRVSTESEEQESSYEAQVSHYTAYIAAHPGWTLAGIYADEGISGTQVKPRTQFNAMIEACESHDIDMILTKSISRFARNTLDCLNYIRRLKELGIPIIFEKENTNTLEGSGELLTTILASIAQQESASISQNVRMGIRFGFQEGRGRLNYTNFLGYTRDIKPGTYRIVPEEARLVRRIYREYLDGSSPGLIAQTLTLEGVHTPARGQTWYASTVSSILSNERYCGDLLMQKYFVESYLTHRIVKNQGQKPRYLVEDNHDPIVPKAVFHEVQAEMKRRSRGEKEPGKPRPHRTHALEGRLLCGLCGRTLKRYEKAGKGLPDWRCRQRAQKNARGDETLIPPRCALRIVPEEEARAAILAALSSLPARKEELNQILLALRDEIASLDRQLQTLREAAEREAGLSENPPLPAGEAPSSQPAPMESALEERLSLRAEKAHRAHQVRNLLELIGELEQSSEEEKQEACTEDGACTEYEDFFQRTGHRIPAASLQNGSLVSPPDALLIRHLDRVLVTGEAYLVCLKAGIQVRVKRQPDDKYEKAARRS